MGVYQAIRRKSRPLPYSCLGNKEAKVGFLACMVDVLDGSCMGPRYTLLKSEGPKDSRDPIWGSIRL